MKDILRAIVNVFNKEQVLALLITITCCIVGLSLFILISIFPEILGILLISFIFISLYVIILAMIRDEF